MGHIPLSRLLTLEARETLPDGSGGFSARWAPLGRLWANVTARTRREDFIAGRAVPRVTYRILVRGAAVGSPSRPSPQQRFREGERTFAILTVAEHDQEGRYLEIMAEEGVMP